VALAPGAAGAHQLSGLTWATGERYYAVSDSDGTLYEVSIALDHATGRIERAAVGAALPLPKAKDIEGVALAATGKTVFVTDEEGPALREYRLADGALLRSARVPAIYLDQTRKNLSFEALTRDGANALWTGNEDALKSDGPTTSSTSGSLVRLQRFDADLRPTAQYAYPLDSVEGDMLVHEHGTGLSELVALPDGRLLALERSLSVAGLRIRLYELDVSGAADVAKLSSLAGATVVPVTKRLLWERRFADDNFEGAALGPRLADGSHSVVLISDDGHNLAQALYPLRLRRHSGERAAAKRTPADPAR